MIDLKIEEYLLMKLIAGVYKHEISSEQIAERVKMFAIAVADKQRECCALWADDSSVIDCPLVSNDLND